MSEDLRAEAQALAESLGVSDGGALDYSGGPIKLTEQWTQRQRAQCVPGAYFSGGAWFIPPDPDPESARYALRLFPQLQATHPDLVASARLSAVADTTPIDFASAHWLEGHDGRVPADVPLSEDPWRRVLAAAAAGGITPHAFQRTDAGYFIDRLDKGLGAYAGHEMGLGKSLLACMVADAWANFILVVCPNSAKHDPWSGQLARFAPWLQVVVMGNTPKARQAAFDEAKALGDAGTPFALVVHYEALALIEGKNKKGWKPLGRWDLLVLDEAHVLKSRTAMRTAAVRRVDRCGTLMLSGSVNSGPAERLFVPLQILRKSRYRAARRDWVDPYFDVVRTDYSEEVVGPKPQTLAAMRAELGEMLVVRRAKDHLSVPEPVVVEHSVGLYPEQKRIYHELADELMADLPDGSVVTTTDGAALMTALRRVTGGVPQDDGGLLSTKLDRAVELIEGAGDSQVLVFGWHKAPLVELRRRLLERRVGCGLVTGDVPKAERERVIDLYKRGGYSVLAATISTLGVAANLQNTGVVLFLEDSYDPSDNEQALGRAVRQGQAAHVSVHYIRCRDTVDDLRVRPAGVAKQELRRLVLGL